MKKKLYNPPKLLTVDYRKAVADCSTSGSSDADLCFAAGNNAGANCETSGTAAQGICDIHGFSAITACSSMGQSAI